MVVVFVRVVFGGVMVVRGVRSGDGGAWCLCVMVVRRVWRGGEKQFQFQVDDFARQCEYIH